MSKEKLDSDRVNYLIWRYLIESEYLETAVHLQKEWDLPNPQKLPFSDYVGPHALVSILNKGLLYHVHEREFAQNHARAGAATERGLFGPLMPPSPAAVADEDYERDHVRKHPIDMDQTPDHAAGPPTKKARLFTNGYEAMSTPMDLDDERAYPSPEHITTPIVPTSGPDQGTQCDGPRDLTPDTVFLELTESPTAKGVILAQSEFHPRDPLVLAAAGSDALARMWTLAHTPRRTNPSNASTNPNTLATLNPNTTATHNPDTDMRSASGSGSESPEKPILAPHQNLYGQGTPITTQATALSWSPTGEYLAIASQPSDNGIARVDFWLQDGSLVASQTGLDTPALGLKWNFSGSACVVISPRNCGVDASITVIFPDVEVVLKQSLSSHSLVEQFLEAVWTSDEEFVVCGGDLLQAFHCTANSTSLVLGRKFEVHEGAMLSKIAYDFHFQLLAAASDSGMIHIWDPSGQCRSFNAHQGVITSLVWQSLKIPAADVENAERLLASAGEDGAISIWNARSIDLKSKASMTMQSGVSALAFSPDGVYLAGATNDNIHIWTTDNVYAPRAIWNRQYESGWQTPQSHESGTVEEDLCSLCWDAYGRRLAYGVNSRLAVINFQP